jgi:hypothetical protein
MNEADRFLLLRVRNQATALAHAPAELCAATKVAAAPALVALHFSDPFAGSVALALGDR